MSKLLKIPVLALTLASFVFAAPLQAMAGQNSYNKKQHYKSQNKHNYYNKHNNQYKKYKKHNKRSYYGGGYSKNYYGGRNYYGNRNHRDNSGAIALGVLTGGLLFYALSSNSRKNNTTYVQQQTPVYVQQQAPVYVQPQQQQTWVAPAPAPQSSCLQVREYTTTVEIGGKTVPAYGNACLQPDGSWKFGQPIAEPVY